LRTVIDTNIFIAGLLNAEGGAAKIIEHFRNSIFELVITKNVFMEYLRVIHFFDNDIPLHKSEELLSLVFEKAVKVEPKKVASMCKDAGDEKFLVAAISGEAEYIVTKNKKDFPHTLSIVKIVSVKEFLSKIEEAQG
jgi:putative PIN family toxin of toxin-antitoxin system